jgi:hypothetical protein
VPLIVQALCEHDLEVTRRLNHELGRKREMLATSQETLDFRT